MTKKEKDWNLDVLKSKLYQKEQDLTSLKISIMLIKDKIRELEEQ